jgi:hypothetical protein
MKMHSLSWSSVRNILSQNKLALRGGVLLCLAPLTALAQSVTFGGQQIVLPFSGLYGPAGVAVDGAGDLFISDTGNNRVLELPWTATGSLTQRSLTPSTETPSPKLTIDTHRKL